MLTIEVLLPCTFGTDPSHFSIFSFSISFCMQRYTSTFFTTHFVFCFLFNNFNHSVSPIYSMRYDLPTSDDSTLIEISLSTIGKIQFMVVNISNIYSFSFSFDIFVSDYSMENFLNFGFFRTEKRPLQKQRSKIILFPSPSPHVQFLV